MNELTELQRRDIIANFYERHLHLGKAYTVHHYAAEGIPSRSVYHILRMYEERGTTVRKGGSGGHNKKLTAASRAAIVRSNINKNGVSLRQLAKKNHVNPSTMCRLFKSKGVQCYKRERAPQYTEEQMERIKRNARKLVSTFQGRTVLVDDESYFRLKSDNIPGNDHFFTADKITTPPDVRFKAMQKFPTQLLVWLCISPHGVSEPFFLERPNSINGEIYRQQCIQDKLMKFINSHQQPMSSIIFWPDLAPAHYAKATTDLLTSLSVPFVPKIDNPPNLPQCRPIENFWSLLKSEVYKDGWEAKTIRQLKMRITAKLKTIDFIPVQNDFASMRRNLRRVARDGPYATF
jgi:transposase